MTRTILFILAAIGLSACSTAQQVEHRARAVAETVRMQMPVDPEDNGLTWTQIDLIASIAQAYKARGHGPLVISYPEGAGNSDASIRAIALARTQLYEAGLDWQQIAGNAYLADGQSSAPVYFSFNQYKAIAPNCELGWENMRIAPRDTNSHQFGCATEANLAAMIANPRDLELPRTMDPSDSGRRQGVIEGYRAGESTSSERSDNESGAVSTAVGN